MQAASTFVVKADEIASTPDSYSATQPEVESLAQVKSRVLDSLQYLIKSGVLIASDFTTFAPASVRQALAKADPDQNACAKQYYARCLVRDCPRPAMRLERLGEELYGRGNLRLGDF
ncbi:MAG: hypothetical protein WA645_00505 [Pseudolabrys sp.]